MENTEYQPHLQIIKDTQKEIRELVKAKMRNAALELVHGLFNEEIEGLCGPAFSHKKGKDNAHRGGSDDGSIKLDGQRLWVKKPRARKNGKEIHLDSYNALQDFDLLCENVMRHMLSGVSTRNYDGLLTELTQGLGLKKSSVSKAFKKGSLQSLDEINGRDLSSYKFVSLMIDGIEFGGRTVVSVLGITSKGKKLNIGLREGDTENTEVVTDLLNSLIDRGLNPNIKMLFVIDGGKALRKAIKKIFGKEASVQRCVRHKERNVVSYLPWQYHAEFRRKWKALHGFVDYYQALKSYKALAGWLSKLNHEALNSLEEAEMETLTVVKLKVPNLLRKTLLSTNAIESCFSGVRAKTNRVKNWKSGNDQISRWAAAALLDVEKRFRTVRGFKEIPILVQALGNITVANQEKIA